MDSIDVDSVDAVVAGLAAHAYLADAGLASAIFLAITVPELGTFSARVPPLTVLTSNRTRDVHDALKRRCLYHWISHPDFDRELAILRVRAPDVSERLAAQVASAVAVLRELDLYKP